jgi:hypothetical protein
MHVRAPFFALLLLGTPMAGIAGDEPAAPAKPVFDLKHTELQKLLRAAVTVERDGIRLQPAPRATQEIPATRVAASLGNLGQPPLRRPAATECREHECIAYDEKGNVLYTTPKPEPVLRIPDLDKDAQLRCLSTHEMLPTWQRVEACDR